MRHLLAALAIFSRERPSDSGWRTKQRTLRAVGRHAGDFGTDTANEKAAMCPGESRMALEPGDEEGGTCLTGSEERGHGDSRPR